MWKMKGKSRCAIFILAVIVNLSNGYHIETPASISGSFSGSSSSASSFSSASSSSFSGAIGGNLDSQHLEKLVDGLKTGALAGATAGAFAGVGEAGCSGDCTNGVKVSPVVQDNGAYNAKYSANNVNSNIIPSGSGVCESCKGPFPGPNGSIHDFKLVSEIQGNSIAPAPAVPTIPQVAVPAYHSEPPKHVVSQFPGTNGGIYESKPVSNVPTTTSVGQSGAFAQAGASAGSFNGYQTSQGHHGQNTFAGVPIHQGTSLSPEFIAKLPGAPGSIHDSISSSGSHTQSGAGAVSGTIYHSAPTVRPEHIPALPGAPGSIHDSVSVTQGHTQSVASSVPTFNPGNIPPLPGKPGSIHDSVPVGGSHVQAGSGSFSSGSSGHPFEVSNIPSKHPLEGPACVWRPGSPPGGCEHAPEIIVPAPQPNPTKPSIDGLGSVLKPNIHLFPGPSGSIHESKPVPTSSVNIAGSHSTANSGSYSHTQAGNHDVPSSSVTGIYSEYDLPSQGVYYINKNPSSASLPSVDLEAPYQHPPVAEKPSFGSQIPCNEEDQNCGVKPVIEPVHATERTPSCIGGHCDGQVQPVPPTPVLVHIGPNTGPKPNGGAYPQAVAGTTNSQNSASQTYTNTNQGFQTTQYKPFPSPNCLNGGSCTGEYPKPNCEGGVCGQPTSEYTNGQKPGDALNLQPSTVGNCQTGKCQTPSTNDFATGHVTVYNQGNSQNTQAGSFGLHPKPSEQHQQQPTDFPHDDGTYKPEKYDQQSTDHDDGQYKPEIYDSGNTGFATGQVTIHKKDEQPTNHDDGTYKPEKYEAGGFATGQVNIHKQDNGNIYQKPTDGEYKPQPSDFGLHNIACQRNGLCGQKDGGTGQLMYPIKDSGFATGSVIVHKQDGAAYNLEEDTHTSFNQQNQPDSTSPCQGNGACGHPGFSIGLPLIPVPAVPAVPQGSPGFATGNVYVHKHDGSKIEVVEDGQLATQGSSSCSSGLCGFGSGNHFGGQGTHSGTGFASGQVVLQKNDGSLNDITNSAGPYGNQGSHGNQGSFGNQGSYSGGQASSYGGGTYSSGQKYGCLSGSCSDGGSSVHGSGTGSYGGGSNGFQSNGALAGSKTHGGGSYSSSGAFASSGSFGGHPSGLSRLTNGAQSGAGASAGSFAKAGAYAGAGSSAGSYASSGSFASSY